MEIELDLIEPVDLVAEAPLTITFSLVDEFGQVRMSGTAGAVVVLPGLSHVDGLPPSTNHCWGFELGWLERGPQPTARHTYNWVTKAWERPLGDYQAELLARIEQLRGLRMVSPIEYQGAALDADLTAQRNISAKIQEIVQRENLGQEISNQMLIWRDADNLNHQFNTMAEYKDWLGGLAIAITERGTLAYAWAWEKKAAVNSATTVEELQAIQIE